MPTTPVTSSCILALLYAAISPIALAFEVDKPNGNADYEALRNVQPKESYLVENLEIKRDIGTLKLKSGHLSFSDQVLGAVTSAVFTGDGEFTMTPTSPSEIRNLLLFTEDQSVRESFRKAVLIFTDDTYEEVTGIATPSALDTAAAGVLKQFRERVRFRPKDFRSSFDATLLGEQMDNIDADLLADLYNPARGGAFSAYLFGQKHEDLRFHVRPRGGLPQIDLYEEVALLNVSPSGKEEGVWYLSNLADESAPDGDKRQIDARHYRIDSEISGNRDITAHCELRFRAVADGARVLKFALLPDLRVSGVVLSGHGPVEFIQEPRREDGSFYVVLPEGAAAGQEYELSIDYGGEKVIEDAGEGSFFVRARTSWYPSVNSFASRATFDLSFRYPSKYQLVSVGRRVEEGKDGKVAYSKWSSDIPLAVAGFNYGRFKQSEVVDDAIGYTIEGYAGSALPDWLRGTQVSGMSPSLDAPHAGLPTLRLSPNKMMAQTVTEAQVAMRVFTNYFGAAPYGRIAITQQPQMNFGQSWPSLVYLPIIAYLDGTQRWMLFGSGAFELRHFIQEVTPHEVAHQWWGHMVGCKSYHDAWLMEGFADFSAGLFLLVTNKSQDKFLQFVDRWHDEILEKNKYGFAPNDAGPIWMGERLNTPRTPRAYSSLIYPKGGYVLHMLRQMLWNPQTGDATFRDMMQEYVTTHLHKNASTESFQRVAENHMNPGLDLDNDGGLDWFFDQWVYGNEIPSYRLDYDLAPQPDGTVLLGGTVTQSGVSDNFRMPVPVYVELDGRPAMIGRTVVRGASTSQRFEVRLPKQPDRVAINRMRNILAAETTSEETKTR